MASNLLIELMGGGRPINNILHLGRRLESKGQTADRFYIDVGSERLLNPVPKSKHGISQDKLFDGNYDRVYISGHGNPTNCTLAGKRPTKTAHILWKYGLRQANKCILIACEAALNSSPGRPPDIGSSIAQSFHTYLREAGINMDVYAYTFELGVTDKEIAEDIESEIKAGKQPTLVLQRGQRYINTKDDSVGSGGLIRPGFIDGSKLRFYYNENGVQCCDKVY